MAVRVKLRIELANGEDCEVNCLVNSGFESDRAELMIPIRLAEQLRIYPNIPKEGLSEVYSTAGGLTRVTRIPDYAIVTIITDDRVSKPVKCDIVICTFVEEVLINDLLTEELSIAIEAMKRGLWRFADEPSTKLRKSVSAQRWA